MRAKSTANKKGVSASLMAVKDAAYCVITGDKSAGAENTEIFSFTAQNMEQAVNGAVNLLRDKLGGNYAVIKFLIPDPLVSFESFSSAGPGAGNSRLRELLSYKTAQKAGFEQKDSLFYMAKHGGKNGVLAAGFSVERGIVKNIEDIFQSNGLVLSLASPAITCVLDKLSQDHDISGSMVFISTAQYWTMALCSGAGVITFMVSNWHEPGQGIKAAFAEVERKLRAYAAAQPGMALKRIYIGCSDQGVAGAAAEAAFERFDAAVINIKFPGRYEGVAGSENIPFPLVMAAGTR
jgi:hypothetical protein